MQQHQQQLYQNLAESLANLFAPMAEVALFDQTDQLICIFNRLTHEPITSLQSKEIVKLVINKQQSAKALRIPLENNYYLRIIVDTSLFESLQTLLQRYLLTPIKEADETNWQAIVDCIIQKYLEQHQTTLTALSTREKRTLILTISEKNLFRYQDATKYLASKFNVSRATIYNYLKQASEFKSLEIHQVDAFTDEPFSGNPAGVVLDADRLNDITMKKIAREMNLSETAFLLTSKKADIKLRYFTPSGDEVKFCGHSTVGALYMLAHKQMLGMTKPGRYALSLEANVGIIPVAISLKPDHSITVEFQTPKVDLIASKITHQEIAQALGIPIEVINQRIPIRFEQNNQDLYVTIQSLKQLGELQIDQKSAKQYAEAHDIVAYTLLCPQTFAKNAHIHMRCFAPAVGIPEDPFTGSVLGGLAAYITQYKLIDNSIKTVRVEQGHFISRPGFVELKLNKTDNSASPLVIAKARHFFSTEINL
jgi:PhzF family phenazine biosynthesis protein